MTSERMAPPLRPDRAASATARWRGTGLVRGMHYMAWHRDQWNYHPSLPMKRLGQIDDVEACGGEVLLWSCMGSGGIGLPYLDKELNEPVPGRLRFYGHLNDGEFARECARRGVLAFAVVWNAQLWEFPAEFDQDEAELKALNIPRGDGEPGWLGLSELSRDRYPKLYRSMRDFFPDGLLDGENRPIVDYLDAFKQVTLDGADILSTWLMAPGHDHRCHAPCGSDPAYRAYVRRQVEMMIDAGAGGIMVDEPDAMLVGMRRGGCFCDDCRRGFRDWLVRHPSEETAGLDLGAFDYRDHLRALGWSDARLARSVASRRWDVPLFRAYVDYVYDLIVRNLADVADHARDYARRTRGEAVPVSANVFNYYPEFAPLRRSLDFLTGEKSGLGRRQDGWYRFAHAFQAGLPSCLIEDPTTHVLDIVEDLKNGRNDAYDLLMLEPLAFGMNLAVPYGAWLINRVPDAMYPDLRNARRMADWLSANQAAFTGRPTAEVAVVYDQRAAARASIWTALERDKDRHTAFHRSARALSEAGVSFRVVYVSDDDPLSPDRLAGLTRALLPECDGLAATDLAALAAWRADGGLTASVGAAGAEPDGPRFADPDDPALIRWMLDGCATVIAGDAADIGWQLQAGRASMFLHVVNYAFDPDERTCVVRPQVEFDLAWSPRFQKIASYPGDGARVELRNRRLVLRDLPTYTVVELSKW